MPPITRTTRLASIAVGAILSLSPPACFAQGLGGYGAMASGSLAGMGMSPTTVAPFGGRFGAAMPSGMGTGGSLAFRPRPSTSMMSTPRTSFTLSPMGGAMSGRAGMGSARRPFVLMDLGTLTGPSRPAGMRSMPAPGGMGVMPPSFASPFRLPPNLAAPSSAAAMSM